MRGLTERLRGVLTTGSEPRASASRGDGADAERAAAQQAVRDARIADALGGDWCTARTHPFLRVERRYAPGHRHGRMPVVDAAPPASGYWPSLPLLMTRPGERAGFDDSGTRSGRLVFLDLETTGLAGGAGTYAFLVGCAWFDGAALRIRQYFLSHIASERALLEDVAELARDAAGVVTFNGKTFDIPLIETRFAMHRLGSAFAELPHVDMLHVARRLWRRPGEPDDSENPAEGRGCRLSDLEQVICGHEREGDVPGFEIPARYFNFVRSGDAGPLEPVFEHNRLDLISLAMLTARAASLLDEGPEGSRDAREALGLGGLYERAGQLDAARTAYGYAATQVGDAVTRAEALRAGAVLARRQRRFDEAAQGWQRVLDVRGCPPGIAREATEALAVHHEHRQRDLDRAREFALQSLQYRGTPSRQQAAHHRLARLDRKLGRPVAPLF